MSGPRSAADAAEEPPGTDMSEAADGVPPFFYLGAVQTADCAQDDIRPRPPGAAAFLLLKISGN